MKWFRQTSHLWGLIPALLFSLIFVGYALVMALLESIYIDGQWTLDSYVSLIGNQAFRDSITFSLIVTIISVSFSLILGVIITRWLYFCLLKYWMRSFIWIPMLFPHFVWGYIVILIFSQSGWVSAFSYHLGFIGSMSAFPVITRDPSGIGIIVTYISKLIPFVVLIVLPAYIQLNKQYRYVVETLGGNKWDIFKTIEWPYVFPVISEAGIIIFAFVLSAFEVPFLLGASYPKMVSTLSYEWFFQGDWSQRPMAFAVMTITTLIIMICSILLFSVSNRARIRLAKGGG